MHPASGTVVFASGTKLHSVVDADFTVSGHSVTKSISMNLCTKTNSPCTNLTDISKRLLRHYSNHPKEL